MGACWCSALASSHYALLVGKRSRLSRTLVNPPVYRTPPGTGKGWDLVDAVSPCPTAAEPVVYACPDQHTCRALRNAKEPLRVMCTLRVEKPIDSTYLDSDLASGLWNSTSFTN